MAIVSSMAKAQVEAGMPPYLSAQLQRGQVLKKTIVYKAGTTATPASSTIVDLPLPPGVVIDVSSIALTHDGIGAGNVQLGLQVIDKKGNSAYSESAIFTLAATATAGEIVRAPSTSMVFPAGAMIFDPAQHVIGQGVEINGEVPTYALLKEKYEIVLFVTNGAAIGANKTFTMVMDLIIP